jgi:hypothetical protein
VLLTIEIEEEELLAEELDEDTLELEEDAEVEVLDEEIEDEEDDVIISSQRYKQSICKK